MNEPTNSLDSDIRYLSREFSTIQTDVKNLERVTMRLRYALEGEDGNGGIKMMVAQISARQQADSQSIRLAVWYPATISTLAFVISVIALIVALTQ